MEYRFEDILEIRNGKNQKAVENPEGRYPIYGSGGVIGYADDYICEADTLISEAMKNPEIKRQFNQGVTDGLKKHR